MLSRFLTILTATVWISACTLPGLSKLGDGDSTSAAPPEHALTFAVVGDLPYNDDQKFALDRYITPRIAEDTSVPFVVHLGDYKGGRKSPCTKAAMIEHQNWMLGLPMPVFYTPGDNEWTDCDRKANRPVRSSLGELKNIRSTFFDPPPAVPKELNAVWQNSAPENALWSLRDVVFATLHVSGSNNGRNAGKECSRGIRPKCDKTEALIADAQQREQSAFAWIDETFARAGAENAKAVVFATQADLTAGNKNLGACTEEQPIKCNAYALITSHLIAGAKAFEKPVLVMHGDTSPYCLDRAFGGEEAPHLWRLNAAGDFVLIDAVRVTVQPNAKEPFQAIGVQSFLTPGTC